MGSKIQMNLTQANIKNMLLAVMAINYVNVFINVLMINLVSFLSHTWLNMLFLILLIIQLEKGSAVGRKVMKKQ